MAATPMAAMVASTGMRVSAFPSPLTVTGREDAAEVPGTDALMTAAPAAPLVLNCTAATPSVSVTAA